MYPKPTLKDRVAASLKVLGLRPVSPEEGAARLNKVSLPDSLGNAWTPETLAAYMEEHNIRPEVLPDLSHFRPVTDNRSWTNGRIILRTIERGFDEEQDALREQIINNAEVRQAVIEICSTVNDNPYDPGLYRRWLTFAHQHE